MLIVREDERQLFDAGMIADVLARVGVVRDSLAGGEGVSQRLLAGWRQVAEVIVRTKKASMRARQLGVHAAIEGTSQNAKAAASFVIVAERMRALAESMATTMDKIADIVRHTIAAAERADRVVRVTREQMDEIIRRLEVLQTAADSDRCSALQERLDSFRTGHDLGEQADKAVGAISDAAKDAERLLTQVSSVASDTQVLAINAAIQALRAGVHGQGFNVVASEMGRLAQQTFDDVVLVVGNTTKLGSRTERFRADSGKTMAAYTAAHDLMLEATRKSGVDATPG